MEAQLFEDRGMRCRWASDVSYDGIRLEVIAANGDVLFDVGVPDEGPFSVNTFGVDVDADLIVAAIELARQR